MMRGSCRPQGTNAHGIALFAAISAFSQQLTYTCKGHEPLPFFCHSAMGASEARGERDESRLEPSPRTHGYVALSKTNCLCPARRVAQGHQATATRQRHGHIAAPAFSLLDLRAPAP